MYEQDDRTTTKIYKHIDMMKVGKKSDTQNLSMHGTHTGWNNLTLFENEKKNEKFKIN